MTVSATATGYPSLNNNFSYAEMDPVGYAVPLGTHIRRMNPRDTAVSMNRRRMIRRGATLGPPYTRAQSRATKQACKAGDEKSRAECRQEKRNVKQKGRQNGSSQTSQTPSTAK